MALLTRQPGVLAFQHVARLRVVEALQGGFPTNELEILSVVFGMAARAVFLRGLRIHHGGMVAAMRGESLGNFRVAFEASEFLAASPQTMAEGALRGPAPSLVRPGKGSGRDLRAGRDTKPQPRPCDCKEQPDAPYSAKIHKHRISNSGTQRNVPKPR